MVGHGARIVPTSTLAIVVGFALGGAGGLPSTTANATELPTYDELPVGAMPLPPTKRPRWIGPHEKVAGLLAVAPSSPKLTRGKEVMLLVGDAAHAARLRKGDFATEDLAATCITAHHGEFDDPSIAAAGWPESGSPVGTAFPASSDSIDGGVNAFHTERVVANGAQALLESVDVWVDPRTGGVREAARGSLPLRLLKEAFGVRVYAARERRPTGMATTFVVARVATQTFDSPRLEMLNLQRHDREDATSGCQHLRTTFTSPAGESAIVTAPVLLAILDRETKPKSADDADDDPNAVPTTELRELRIRPMQIQLSVSRVERDPVPVLSVSLGWGGREQTERGNVPIAKADTSVPSAVAPSSAHPQPRTSAPTRK